MFVVVIFTTTSVGFSIFASGTESTLTSFVPWYTRAFMILLRFFYDGGALCARRYSGGRASRTSPGETSRGAGHGGRRCPHAANPPGFSTYRSKCHFRSGIVSLSLSAYKPAVT